MFAAHDIPHAACQRTANRDLPWTARMVGEALSVRAARERKNISGFLLVELWFARELQWRPAGGPAPEVIVKGQSSD